jgi:hypothetical protein
MSLMLPSAPTRRTHSSSEMPNFWCDSQLTTRWAAVLGGTKSHGLERVGRRKQSGASSANQAHVGSLFGDWERKSKR